MEIQALKENIQKSLKPKAIILTSGMLHQSDAKTAHGLIRGTDRYNIIGVIDELHSGKDAGEVLDGVHRNITIFSTVDDAVAKFKDISYCIIGIATHGGYLPNELITIIQSCIKHKMSVVNGLHEYLCDHAEIAELAASNNVKLIDIRKPRSRKELHFWSGEIFKVTAPIIAVIGMDCAIGKRTTCRLIMQSCKAENINAQMIYTGQTGWLQGGKFGFIFDSTLNDFIAGELEHAIISCWQQTKPDVILLEGQAALRNPSGPCGSELLVSGNAKHTILVHAPKRKYYDHLPLWGEMPSVQSEIDLIKMYGSTVIAVALNTEYCTADEAADLQKQYEHELQIPVLLPLEEGVTKIIPTIRSLISNKK